MKTLKEYAESKNVSYEAVRKKVKLYRAELGEHIFKKGRAQFLDDTAIQFLDEHSIEKSVVVYDAKKDEEIQQLQTENKQLYQQLVTVQSNHVKTQEQLQEQTDKLYALEVEKLRIEGEKKQEQTARERAESAEKQIEKRLQQLQARRLSFRERVFGRLEVTD